MLPGADDAASSAEIHETIADTDVPDVSVIVPVYNSATWLHECLLSILGQSGVSMEVICVNDGSTDDSLRILHEYATSDPRVIIVDRPNGGLSAARNSGIDAARGRYTCMIDSDDYWRTDELADLVERADRDRLDMLLFDAQSFFEPGVSESSYKAYATYYLRKRSYSTVVEGSRLAAEMSDAHDYRPSACLYLIRTGMLKASDIRFIPGIMHEDNPFTFALLINAQRTAHVQNPIYARRVRPGSIMTAGTTERSMRGYFVAYLEMKRTLAHHPVPGELGAVIGDLLNRVFSSCRRLFLGLPDEAGDRILGVDPSPEARSTYLIMRHERNQARKIEKLSKGS